MIGRTVTGDPPLLIGQQHWRVLERTRLSVRDPHDAKAAAQDRAARFREASPTPATASA